MRCGSPKSNREMRKKPKLRYRRRLDVLLKLPENVETKKKKRLGMTKFGNKDHKLRPLLLKSAMKNSKEGRLRLEGNRNCSRFKEIKIRKTRMKCWSRKWNNNKLTNKENNGNLNKLWKNVGNRWLKEKNRGWDTVRSRIGKGRIRVWWRDRSKNAKSYKLKSRPTKPSKNKENFSKEERWLPKQRDTNLNANVIQNIINSNSRPKKNQKRWSKYFKTRKTSSLWRRKRCFHQWPKQIKDNQFSRKNRKDKSK